jgi:DNA-binding MarR family transcriptional regulator
MVSLAEFDEKTGALRVTIFLYKHPGSHITKIINSSGVKQKTVYAVLNVLKNADMLEITKNTEFPYNPLYSLNGKGKLLGKLLVEVQILLDF